ncbi:MAG: hypothetical protein H6752_02945 [Candidatus Omnitrophica bacterium]|nr:hypothetical protein [Candidatus Omnitrophota bacterium]
MASSLSADSVLRYDGTTGDFIDEFVSSGSRGLDDTQDLTFGPDGNLYVSSGETDEVLKVQWPDGSIHGGFCRAREVEAWIIPREFVLDRMDTFTSAVTTRTKFSGMTAKQGLFG